MTQEYTINDYYTLEEINHLFQIHSDTVKKKIVQGEIRAGIVPDVSWKASIIMKDPKVDSLYMRSLQGVWFLPLEDAILLLTQKSNNPKIPLHDLETEPDSDVEVALLDQTLYSVSIDDIVITEQDLTTVLHLSGGLKKSEPKDTENSTYDICCELAQAINETCVNAEHVNKNLACPDNSTDEELLFKIRDQIYKLASIEETCRFKNGKPRIGTSNGGIIKFLRIMSLAQLSDSTYQYYFKQALEKE